MAGSSVPSVPHAIPRLRVSVALCTYNGTRFLPQLLESIVGQTQLPDELVVCDDGSTDDTISVLECFASSAPFAVRIFRNPVTLRPAQNFARCLELCEQDVVLLSDQDDLWFPDRVAMTASAFAVNSRLLFTFSDCPLIDQEGRDMGRTIYSSIPVPAPDRRRLEQGSSLLPVLLRWGVLYGTSMAIRASLRRLFLPLPLGWSHDEWIGLCLSAAGDSARMPHPVTYYRQHAAQQVGTGDWTLGTHLGLAQDHGRAFYRAEVKRFEAALVAIAPHPELQRLQQALQRKLDFLLSRLQIQDGGFRQLPLFLSTLFRGEYRRFSSGLRSPLKDFAMMAGGFAGSR